MKTKLVNNNTDEDDDGWPNLMGHVKVK